MSAIQVEPTKFTKQIAFNVIPHIDVFLDDGSTKEEWKMVAETKKILDPKVKVQATCVRVPVFVGHSESLNIEFENEISATQAQDILREAPGIMLVDKREDGGYVTPVECVGDYATYISRVREDSDRRERPCAVVRVGQSAQGRGAERGADRGAAGPQASQEGLIGEGSVHRCDGRSAASMPRSAGGASPPFFGGRISMISGRVAKQATPMSQKSLI